MPSLNNAKFWDDADKQLGALQQDRGMKYMMLEGSYKMLPVLRNVDKTFSDFLLADAGAKKARSSSTAISGISVATAGRRRMPAASSTRATWKFRARWLRQGRSSPVTAAPTASGSAK